MPPRRFSPVHATRGRHASRQGGHLQGTLGSWTSETISKVLAESQQRRTADRALDLYANDAMAHGILEGLVAEAVGVGLTPQFQPDFEALGLTREWAEQYKRAASRMFRRWGMDCRCFCDRTGRLTFPGLQALAYFGWRLDGMGLFQVVWDENPLRPLNLSLQPIDSWRMATPLTASRNDIYDGVEVDRGGRPVALHIRKAGLSFDNRAEAFDRFEMWDKDTGLPRFLMVTGVRNPAEYREDSILGPVIKELRDNKDFVDAALVRALLQNMFVLFVRKHQAGSRSSKGWDERVLELEKGTILEGDMNEEPTFMKSDAPGPGFDVMFNAIVKRLGMATARGPENITRQYVSSYSASKASIERSNQITFTEHAHVLNPKFNVPAAAWVLYEAAIKGKVPARSRKHFVANLFEYTLADWLPQPLIQLDRQKGANADKTELASGTRTYKDIYAERGKEWREELRQAAEEKAYKKDLENEYGIAFDAPDEGEPEPLRDEDILQEEQ